ncbi:MAG: zf-HC2 domain-containing protein, partial [Candidatus Eremiobacteraeota bacterium]|nr:zf-HC2 domain-containing protein [Candidatus Eremiobacteraeota bacterium]
MNERRPPHEMLDDVAVYALGALPPAGARAVRSHLATCPECATEYSRLKSTAALVGFTAETTADARDCPSTLLKPRIMAKVRAQKARTGAPSSARTSTRRLPVWPAYLVAAACIAIAIISSMWNLALTGQLRQAQQELSRDSARSNAMARALADERSTMSDLLGSDAKRYVQNNGEV